MRVRRRLAEVYGLRCPSSLPIKPAGGSCPSSGTMLGATSGTRLCQTTINQPGNAYNGQTTQKVNSCGDVTFAPTSAGLDAAWSAANAAKYYETNWYPGGDQFCTSVTSEEDCDYFGVLGDCWITKYKLAMGGVGCIA